MYRCKYPPSPFTITDMILALFLFINYINTSWLCCMFERFVIWFIDVLFNNIVSFSFKKPLTCTKAGYMIMPIYISTENEKKSKFDKHFDESETHSTIFNKKLLKTKISLYIQKWINRVQLSTIVIFSKWWDWTKPCDLIAISYHHLRLFYTLMYIKMYWSNIQNLILEKITRRVTLRLTNNEKPLFPFITPSNSKHITWKYLDNKQETKSIENHRGLLVLSPN